MFAAAQTGMGPFIQQHSELIRAIQRPVKTASPVPAIEMTRTSPFTLLMMPRALMFGLANGTAV